MRLGETLIAAQVLTQEQLEEALHAQVMLGARLGTCLVELGYVDLDGLSNALAHQQRLPAALASHFDRADHELQLRLSANLAERFACVPLLRVGKRAAVIAATGPLEPRTIAIIADELDIAPDRLIVAIAPELRIRYTLERVYNIARAPRFLRAPGSPRAMPTKLVLPDADVPRLDDPPELEPSNWTRQDTGERRRYVQTLVAADCDDESISIDDDLDLEEMPDDDLSSTVEMISGGSDREEVATLAIAAIRHLATNTEAAVLLSMRGAVAVSSAKFRRDGRAMPLVAIPIDQPSAVTKALRTKMLVNAGPGDHSELDKRLLSSLGLDAGHLVVVPLVTGARVIATLVVASRSVADVAVIETIASAAAGGFARLIREAIE